MSIKEELLSLKPLEKIKLIDELTLSLVVPSKEIDDYWAEEVENRLIAMQNGNLNTIPLEQVFSKYDQ